MSRRSRRRAALSRSRRARRVRTWAVAAAALAAAVSVLVAVAGQRDEEGTADSDTALRTYSIDGRPSSVVVAGGSVWVADDQSDAVHVLDPDTGRTRRSLKVAENPIGLAADGASVWVAHADGTVTRIDAESLEAEAPVRVGESATGVAYGLGRVWVTDLVASELVEIDPEGTGVVGRFPVPQGVVRVTVAGARVWVTNAENTATAVDPRAGVAGTPSAVGPGPIGLASDGVRVWVASSEAGTVSRLDVMSGEPVGDPVAAGKGPVAVAAAASDVWVAAQDSRTLTRIAADDGTISARYELPVHPRGVALGDGAVWVVGTDPGGVVRIAV